MTTMKTTPQAFGPRCPRAKEQADLRPVEGDGADEELATLSKALAHPMRVKIVRDDLNWQTAEHFFLMRSAI